MDNLNSAIKASLETFRTDLSGIRVKKFLKLVRTVQLALPDLEKSETKTIQVFESGHEVCVSLVGDHWELMIDRAKICLDKSNVYDGHGNVTKGSFLAPSVIQTILAA